MKRMSAKAKKLLVPKLRFPEFRDSGEWEVQKIRQNLSESRVKGSKGDVAKKLTVKLWGNGVFEKQETLKGSANTQYYRRKAGQFIYSKLDFLNQAFGIVPDRLDNYESTVDLPCFDVSDELNVCFLLEYVKRKDFYKKYGEIADGGRKAKRIQVETFLDFPMFLPMMREQQKIAACLTALDDLISAATGRLDALKQHKQGLMQQLFPAQGETVPRLRFAEFRDAGEWEFREIREVGDIVTGKTPNTKDDSLWNGNILFITPTDIDEQAKYQISTQRKVVETKETKLLPPGSILYTCIASIGKIAITKIESISNQQINSIITNSKNNNEFIYYCLLHLTPWIKFIPASSTLPIINKQEFSKIKIRITPKIKEQQKIAACLTALDDLIAAQTQKIAKLKTHKRGLMQQLFPAVDEANR